jgi:hypothetical protein
VRNTGEKPAQNACSARKRSGMTIFSGYSESLRMINCDQSRLHGLISIALMVGARTFPGVKRTKVDTNFYKSWNFFSFATKPGLKSLVWQRFSAD